MEKELFFSGYCRQLDGSRAVAVVLENNTVTDCDCAYPECVFAVSCPIAQKIREITE